MTSADEAAASDIFSGFNPCSAPPEAGYFFDFLGTKTRTEYLPESCAWLSGHVFGFPKPNGTILHEFEEWQGVMAAVKEARRSFVCVELGAGWGPWLMSSYFAARHLGISDILLVGVEADATNIEFMKTHFADNRVDPRQHKIINAAVDERNAGASPSHPGGAPMISLNTLLSGLPVVDLIHCDIQFAESKAFAAGIDAVTNRVRRVVIGTHSRKIEDELIETFHSRLWRLEHETACKYRIEDGMAYLYADGVQVWRNSQEPGASVIAQIPPVHRYHVQRILSGIKRRSRRMLARLS